MGVNLSGDTNVNRLVSHAVAATTAPALCLDARPTGQKNSNRTMLKSEGAEAMDVIVRPRPGAGWQVERPQRNGTFFIVVVDRAQALWLAKRIRPEAQVRLLPSYDSPV
ncbi:hypothetical protein AWB74_07665 [Caballeronia arvi]|uniref:Uncharacterized protein n=1 Tax=Caballeronia arvi TaxID=1777135 RepID=A0A158KYW3_9BURK|nr:hypothetical protein [Caballeronia arvi]SAL86346.1 hypothetical protein AWB74_07665 [Caballeronia arvi]